MSIAIRFEDVSKRFALHQQRSRSIQEALIHLAPWRRKAPAAPEEFWALRDVSFEVAAGETVGLIGPNGVGKSTVLKLVSRILEPNSGRVEVNGRVGALLELGAGFHPDLTGRENIYLNGSVLGLQRSEIRRRLDEIVAFAELERFVDVPVKHYSSGMYMRLGFAVAVHTDPEILLVDEVLSVGDAAFQRKCESKIAELRRAGISIMLVSHDLATIKTLCDQAYWFEDGCLQLHGATDKVISAYVQAVRNNEDVYLLNRNTEIDSSRPGELQRYGNGSIEIIKVEMLDDQGKATWVVNPWEVVRIKLHYSIPQSLQCPVFSVLIHREDGLYVAGANTYSEATAWPGEALVGEGWIEVTFESFALARGSYLLSVAAYREPDPPYWIAPGDFHEQAYRFRVESDVHIHGLIALQGQWQLQKMG